MFMQPVTSAGPVMAIVPMSGGHCPPLARHLQGAILCLGNFDGLHLGHRSLVAAARAIARRQGRPLALMSCEPHPRSFFASAGQTPFRLATPEQKRMLFGSTESDYLFEPVFDADFAALTAGGFLHRVLVQRLRVGGIVCGPDFRFGAGRMGDAGTIEDFCRQQGIAACIVDKTVAASSSGIRAALATRDLALAHRQLGRPWQIDLHGTGMQIRPPAGRYLAYSPARKEEFELSLTATGACLADPMRHGRFLDLLSPR